MTVSISSLIRISLWKGRSKGSESRSTLPIESVFRNAFLTAFSAVDCLSAGIREIVTSDMQGFEVFAGLAICNPLTRTGETDRLP